MKCAYHNEVDAICKCVKCGKDICEPCKVEVSGEDQCKECIAKSLEKQEKVERSPGLACFLSFIIAGAGQMYNGQIGKGILILFTGWLIIPWIYGVFDALNTAKKINQGLITPRQRSGCVIGLIVGAFFIFFLTAIIGLMAAIAIPNFLRAKMVAQESSAKASLRTLVTACESYNMIHNSYPENLQALSSEQPPYIDQDLGSGQKQGYSFTYQANLDGTAYTVTAMPIDPNATSQKTFTITEEGKILENQRTLEQASN